MSLGLHLCLEELAPAALMENLSQWRHNLLAHGGCLSRCGVVGGSDSGLEPGLTCEGGSSDLRGHIGFCDVTLSCSELHCAEPG